MIDACLSCELMECISLDITLTRQVCHDMQPTKSRGFIVKSADQPRHQVLKATAIARGWPCMLRQVDKQRHLKICVRAIHFDSLLTPGDSKCKIL